MSYLYLLVDSQSVGFKIGVSVDPAKRMAALPESFDIAKSIQIRCGHDSVYQVEKTLHFLFRDFHLAKARGNGYTEWFSMECFGAVQDFIRSQQGLLGWTHFESISHPNMANVETVRASSDERARRKAKKENEVQKLHLQYFKKNKYIYESFTQWIAELRERQALVGMILTRQCNDAEPWLVLHTPPISKEAERSIYAPKPNDDTLFILRVLDKKGRELSSNLVETVLIESTYGSDLQFVKLSEAAFSGLGGADYYGGLPYEKLFDKLRETIEDIPLVRDPLLPLVFNFLDDAHQQRWNGKSVELW